MLNFTSKGKIYNTHDCSLEHQDKAETKEMLFIQQRCKKKEKKQHLNTYCTKQIKL